MAYTPEEIGSKMDALGIWGIMESYNFAIRAQGTAFPYFCTTMREKGSPVRVRFLMLEGWQTLHDFIRYRIDCNFGVCTSLTEFAHLEMVVLETGEVKIMRCDGGYAPIEANQRQRDLAARILWEEYGVMLRLETDRGLPLRFASEKAMFARIEGADGKWTDAPLDIPNPPPVVESIAVSVADMKAAKDVPFDKDFVVDVDFRLLPEIMTQEPRPRCVYGLIAVDATTGERVIDSRASVDPESGLRGMWESMPQQVLKELIRRCMIPGEIRLRSGRVFRMLRALCMELPFKLSLHDTLPSLDKNIGVAI